MCVCVKGVGDGVQFCEDGSKNCRHGYECLWLSELGDIREVLMVCVRVCVCVCVKSWAHMQIFSLRPVRMSSKMQNKDK